MLCSKFLCQLHVNSSKISKIIIFTELILPIRDSNNGDHLDTSCFDWSSKGRKLVSNRFWNFLVMHMPRYLNCSFTFQKGKSTIIEFNWLIISSLWCCCWGRFSKSGYWWTASASVDAFDIWWSQITFPTVYRQNSFSTWRLCIFNWKYNW